MSKKHVFWQALILAILIFSSGIFLGYLIELNRTSKIITTYQELEINLLDVQVQENIFASEDFDCDQALIELVSFADRVYSEARVLDRFEDSTRLSDSLIFQHKKFSLLRAILWTNSIKVKKQCGGFQTIVYFYERQPDDIGQNAKQKTFSRFLGEVKEEYGNEIILIPIAGNLGSNSVNLLMGTYGVNQLPSVLINENQTVTSIDDLPDIRQYL